MDYGWLELLGTHDMESYVAIFIGQIMHEIFFGLIAICKPKRISNVRERDIGLVYLVIKENE